MVAKVQPLHPDLPDFIETGIPIPNVGRPMGGRTAKIRALAEAPVGSSVFFPNEPTRSARVMLGRAVNGWLGAGNYATRKEGDGVRVWKTAERS